MGRIKLVDPKTAEGKQKELLDDVQQKMGMTPNLMRAYANSPAALKAYLGFSAALSEGVLEAGLREQIALTVAETNGCDYCLAAHSAVGKMVGLGPDEIVDARNATSTESRTAAALQFAKALVDKRGWVSDEDLANVRGAGYGDAEITEIVANVAYNTYSNYFNHVADTPVDFPKADPLPASVK